MNLTIPPTTALSFEFHPHRAHEYDRLTVFGGAAMATLGSRTQGGDAHTQGGDAMAVNSGSHTQAGDAMAKLDSNTLHITHAHGPAGEAARLTVLEPLGSSALLDVRYVTVNGAQPMPVRVRPDCLQV